MRRIAIIGPAYPLRGGLATFDQRLAEQFLNEGDECINISFSLQYPSIFFPGKTQHSNEAPPKGLIIHSIINSINPLNWIKTGNWIRRQKFDLVIVRYWIPFMAPCLGTILREIKKEKHTRIICLVDNITPHEHRFGDRGLSRFFLSVPHAFVTMSDKVYGDLRTFVKDKPAIVITHPLYDNFGAPLKKNQAKEFLGLKVEKVILFFGFIRHYKGLDLLLRAMADERIKKAGIKLLVAGEFYENEKPYRDLIEKHALQDVVFMENNFIPDTEVRYYLSAADVVVQPYRNATQSGVTPLAYHFEKPLVVTNVGGLPALVPHEKVGLVCEPNPSSIAEAILRFYELGEDYFIPHLREEKLKYSWNSFTKAIRQLAFGDN